MSISVRKKRINELREREARIEQDRRKARVQRSAVSPPRRQMGILEMLEYLWKHEFLPTPKNDAEYVAATQQAREFILLGRWEHSPYKEILAAAEEENGIHSSV